MGLFLFPTVRTEIPVEAVPSTQTTVELELTAYCHCAYCTGSDDIGLTASGTVPTEGRTISADVQLYPIGTVINILGTDYIVEDTGSAIKGNIVDVYFDSHDEAVQFGRKTIIAVVQK